MKEPQEFLEYIAKGIVDHPDDVQITASKDAEGNLLTLKVNPEDMGKIIGRSGKTITSIRQLIRACVRDTERFSVKVFDPQKEEELKDTFQVEPEVTQE